MRVFIRLCRAAVLILFAVAFVFLMCACAASDKAIKNANEYLKDKYGNLDFKLIEYTQNKTTNGWYIANIRCNDTKTDFVMYISSLRMTDSYGVTYVNSIMQKKILMGPLAAHKDNVKSVQWLNEFEDGFENYTFRTVDPKKNFEVSDVKSIYRIELKDCKSITEVAEIIYDMMSMFEAFGTIVGKTTFVFEIDKYVYTVVADYNAVNKSTEAAFIKEMNDRDTKEKESNFLNIISIDLTREIVTETSKTN